MLILWEGLMRGAEQIKSATWMEGKQCRYCKWNSSGSLLEQDTINKTPASYCKAQLVEQCPAVARELSAVKYTLDLIDTSGEPM